MKVIAIAAVGRNGVIGRDGGLPWEIPEDLRFFRDSTRGQVVLMGRKTYDSLGKALPKRENAVITRDPVWSASDARVFRELPSAIEFYRRRTDLEGKDLFVIGGAEIYFLAIPFLDEIWLTEIDADFAGDTFFRGFSAGKLDFLEFERGQVLPQREAHPEGLRYHFVKYTRRASAKERVES